MVSLPALPLLPQLLLEGLASPYQILVLVPGPGHALARGPPLPQGVAVAARLGIKEVRCLL